MSKAAELARFYFNELSSYGDYGREFFLQVVEEDLENGVDADMLYELNEELDDYLGYEAPVETPSDSVSLCEL